MAQAVERHYSIRFALGETFFFLLAYYRAAKIAKPAV